MTVDVIFASEKTGGRGKSRRARQETRTRTIENWKIPAKTAIWPPNGTRVRTGCRRRARAPTCVLGRPNIFFFVVS
jgi:hypothetical protein